MNKFFFPTLIILVSINILGWSQNPKNRPNVVFIMADDLGYGDLGCYGQENMRTPNIDKLASEGMRFSQAYAGAPVCAPSRCVLMTGLHNGHAVVRDNVPHYHSYLRDQDITIPEILKKEGYKCGGVGKWSLGDTQTIGSATNQGFDMWFGYLNQDHAHYYYTEYLDDSYRSENQYRYELPGNTKSREFYSHNLMTERALQFIRDSYDEPFFLYVSYTLPHFSAPSEDVDELAVPSTEPYTQEDWEEKSKKYAAMVNMLDADVGRMIHLLNDLNLSDNTIVIFTSDNGGTSSVGKNLKTNGVLRGYKTNLTEGGIRVPFIVRWPGKIPKGTKSDNIIAFQDMMPTIAELTGADTPEGVDGISMANLLFGKKQEKQHRYLYWDYGHCRNRYDQAVRMGKWKGIRLGQGENIQLYDLDTDISEMHNLAEDYPEIVEEITKIMKTAYIPNERYPIGVKYTGSPIWKKSDSE